jgi:hypothetical protein
MKAPLRRVTWTIWALLATIALYRAWIYRFTLVNDTVSYLDMGDQFYTGHPSAIVNGTWGPFYAFLLASWLRLLHVSPQYEYPAIHALLALVFFGCVACFDLFLRELIAFAERRSGEADESSNRDIARSFTVIGYAIFAWATLILIRVEQTNPDMIVAATFFLACGLVLRIHANPGDWKLALALGAAVGVGYLTKAVMLPVGALLVVCAAVAGDHPWTSGRRVAVIAMLTAGCLAAPQVAGLSIQRGHFTTNGTGAFNYAIHVQGVTYRHWQGETAGAGRPLHPTRQLLDSPAVFEFDGPLPGTYPAWFDPSYWYEGVVTHVEIRHQLAALEMNGKGLAELLFAFNGAPFEAIIILYAIALRRGGRLRSCVPFWILFVPSLLALGPYTLVHYENRYVGGFVCVLLVTAIACVPLPRRSLVDLYFGTAILLVTMFFMPWSPTGPWSELRRGPSRAANNVYWNVASALNGAGYGPGTKIATLEYGNWESVLVARLARVKVIAEVYYHLDLPETDRNHFWNASPDEQERALQVLRDAGAKAVLTGETPKGPTAERWVSLGDGGYSYLAL